MLRLLCVGSYLQVFKPIRTTDRNEWNDKVYYFNFPPAINSYHLFTAYFLTQSREMLSFSGLNFLCHFAILLILAELQPRTVGASQSSQCSYSGYKPGGILPGIKRISEIPPAKFETSALDNVLDYFNQGGSISAATLTVIDAFGKSIKGSPQITAALGIFAIALGYAKNSPSQQDVLNKAHESVALLTEEVNERMDQMQDYVDVKVLELEKTIMLKHFGELNDKWFNCAKLRPGRDSDDCQAEAEEDITNARTHFQPVRSYFVAQGQDGKQKFDPHFSYRYAATWQWMKEYEGSHVWTLTYDQVKRLEAGLIPFRDYATLHIIVLETLANTYKHEKGEESCKSYKFYLSKLIEKSDSYVRYAKWAYEWIYIRQYEENMYFGVPRRSGGGPASAFRGGFLGATKCSSGNKCTIECSQMMKDNLCTVQKRRRKKRGVGVRGRAYDLCDSYMGKVKKELVGFWTENLLDVAKRWEKYGENAKKKLAAQTC